MQRHYYEQVQHLNLCMFDAQRRCILAEAFLELETLLAQKEDIRRTRITENILVDEEFIYGIQLSNHMKSDHYGILANVKRSWYNPDCSLHTLLKPVL